MTKAALVAGVLACVAFATASADAAPRKPKKRDAAPKVEATATFDREAAIVAIRDVNLQKCRATNATHGDGHVTITFAPGGGAREVIVDKGPWVGTPVAKCMAREFKKAKVPAFRGDAITVGKNFHFE